MKAKIYYQDFRLNTHALCERDLVFKPEHSTLIVELDLGKDAEAWQERLENIKAEAAEEVWKIFNIFPQKYKGLIEELKPLFEKVQHTSMSVGDYVEFEDGEIWICSIMGWKIIL